MEFKYHRDMGRRWLRCRSFVAMSWLDVVDSIGIGAKLDSTAIWGTNWMESWVIVVNSFDWGTTKTLLWFETGIRGWIGW